MRTKLLDTRVLGREVSIGCWDPGFWRVADVQTTTQECKIFGSVVCCDVLRLSQISGRGGSASQK